MRLLAAVFALVLMPTAVMAHPLIPTHCYTPQAEQDAVSGIPQALQLGPHSATITAIKMMYDSPAMPPDHPVKTYLSCQVRVTWSNGLRQFGFYTEWLNRYDQLMGAFSRMPVPYHYQAFRYMRH